MTSYDAITIGGGLAGAAVAKRLAEAGAKVLVLERETAFKDRVRGEQMHPWGVAEARRLGLLDAFAAAGAREVRWFEVRMAGAPEAPARDVPATNPHGEASLNAYHPALQRAALEAAEAAGAEVRRGAMVTGIEPGRPARVRLRGNGAEESLAARLVVGADGRESAARRWAGFEVRRDPDEMTIAGVLVEGLGAPEDRLTLFVDADRGHVAIAVALGQGRFRAYACRFEREGARPLSGEAAFGAFADACATAGLPRDWFQGAGPAGPLASFQCADRWVDGPYREGVVLVGDAAGASDPAFGCGLSLTLRDARMLTDRLLQDDDWEAAGQAYAAEHYASFGSIHRQTTWLRTLLYDPSPEASAVRARAMPLHAEDPSRMPDFMGAGPEAPSDEAARRRCFGEDVT